ncbi:hypothetical protein ACPPVO_36000 [Dactylosporangium sp. McL0621]|uniref:hypothetical protein n=1 Tax=Dactylosporangium sp. McL0621 TaxID=3415678 RepID=UPI003CF3D11D
MVERTGGARPVRVGDVLRLREADYRFGVGNLRLRVTAAPAESPEPGWMTVTGMEILWNGKPGTERQVHIPVEVLHDPRIRSVR